ncbi:MULTISPECIES: hypothetical protein [Trichocoleus]|uniref:Uncharacterized protein n=1 Tax=Trichocoleus desertorum GB2-A4 TaxID=2933944 RepID=A0ABV0J8G2_9CYAN|nr:hypothetical protein [Trichocoleus sp. FACHB-46]MBD1861077.1 hypothetical protein [Trichocoleus sp. FACHB-46]
MPLMLTSFRVTHLALFAGVLVGLTGVATQFRHPQQPLISQAIAQPQPAAPDSRTDYSPVVLTQLTENGKNLTGQRPSAIVAQLFGATEPLSKFGLEQLEISYSPSGEAIALLTQTGWQDDSVNGVRYRVELQPQPSDIGSQWQVVWVGKQSKCQPGRGHQNWSTALCS